MKAGWIGSEQSKGKPVRQMGMVAWVGEIRKTKGGVGARKIEGETGRTDDDVVGEISLKREVWNEVKSPC
jgi:hypothetical protein